MCTMTKSFKRHLKQIIKELEQSLERCSSYEMKLCYSRKIKQVKFWLEQAKKEIMYPY